MLEPYSKDNLDELFNYQKYIQEWSTKRYVHYTTIDNFSKIIQSKRFWLRSSQVMNDRSEFSYGANIIYKLFQKDFYKFKEILKDIVKLDDSYQTFFELLKENARDNGYLGCFSEHLDNEDDLGRLSMWRAYSRNSNGVAIVFKPNVFFSGSNVNNLISIKVSYIHSENLDDFNTALINDLENKINSKEIKSFNDFIDYIYRLVISIKHIGFCEEKEVRVYFNQIINSDSVETELHTIKNISQIVKCIKLEKFNETLDFSLSKIIDRIIIGPTQYPIVQRNFLIEFLKINQININPDLIICSNIPVDFN